MIRAKEDELRRRKAYYEANKDKMTPAERLKYMEEMAALQREIASAKIRAADKREALNAYDSRVILGPGGPHVRADLRGAHVQAEFHREAGL